MSNPPTAPGDIDNHGRFDYWLLLCNRLIRSFAFGFAVILVPLQLSARGLSPVWIGVVLSLSLGSASLLGLGFAVAAARYGLRRCLAATGILMALAGVDLAFADRPWLFALAGLTGMIGAASVDVGPFLPLEQTLLAQSVEARHRNMAFARYSLTGGLAVTAGSLSAALASNPGRLQNFFVVFTVIGLGAATCPMLLSERLETHVTAPTLRGVRSLLGLSGLFALDSFGGGLVGPAVIAYWLHVRFGAGATLLGPSFAAISLVQAASYELSGRIANRIGLINTMVFTHIPANVLIILVALSPSFPVALSLLLARSAISQMDVPARQAYLVSIVNPDERSAAIAITAAVRGIPQSVGPTIAGLAIQASAFGVPLILGGAVKIAYDIGLFAGFHTRKASHER